MEIKSFKKDSFDALYDAYADKVYNIALNCSGNHHTAEDVTQKVFMKLYINLENINMQRVGQWLMITSKHMAMNDKRDYLYEIPVGIADMTVTMDGKVYMESIEAMLESRIYSKRREELAEEIYQALFLENERWYEAVTITYILQKPQKEVAENMGISLGALQLMLYRAKKWIKKQYQEKLDHLKK